MTSPDCVADTMTDHDLNLPIAVAGYTLAIFWVVRHWLALQLGSCRSPI
jgi:hypothetical protein